MTTDVVEVVERGDPYIGRSLPRVEDAALLQGKARFVDDLRLVDEARLYLVRSAFARARIRSISTNEAINSPGVIDIWTGTRIAVLADGMLVDPPCRGARSTVQPLLALEDVKYVGEPIAAVLAEDLASAKDAADLIQVEYDPLTPVIDLDAALRGEGPANGDLPGNIMAADTHTASDGQDISGEATRQIAAVYSTARCSAAPMEPRGCLASYDEGAGSLTLWDSTQFPHVVRGALASTIGFPENRIEVIAPAVGGGFGQKSHVFPEEILACLLAINLGRPVRWIEERTENLVAGSHAKAQRNDISFEYSENGEVLAARLESVTDAGAYNIYPWGPQIESMTACATLTGAYRIPSAHAEYVCVATNKCPIGAYRGVGWSASQVAREGLLDDLARRLGLSPFEIRRRNVIRDRDLPYTSPAGLVYTDAHFIEALDVLERLVDYPNFLDRQRRARGGNVVIGMGVSLFVEMSGLGTAACLQLGYDTACYDSMSVAVDPTGLVTVSSPFVSQGQGHATTFAQVVADAIGTTPAAVRIVAGSSNAPYGMGTWGSRTMVLAAGALRRAAEEIRAKLIQAAADLLEASPLDVELSDGVASVRGTPSASVPMRDIAQSIYFSTRDWDRDRCLEVTKMYDPTDVPFGMGVHAVVVAIDTVTGKIDVEAVYAVEECGTMVNPAVVDGQIQGGAAQGIGQALFEGISYDDSGQVMVPTLAAYGIPTATDIPDIIIRHLDHTASGERAIKGAGESTMISIPAAVLNAVNDALAPAGVSMDSLPIRPEDIVRAMGTMGG